MSTRRKLARILRRSVLLQLALVFTLWWAGNQLALALHLAFPGAILGMALLLTLLATRRLSVMSVRRGAQWLLADMLLFFVPAVLAVLDHPELAGLLGLKILAAILLSTLAVMRVTAFTVDLFHPSRLADERTAVPCR